MIPALLSGFPGSVRANLGFAIFELQQGKQPSIVSRRMESIGAGVYELKESDEASWYRVIYLARVQNRIYVLHCFQKQSRKTEKRDLEVAAQRLKRVKARLAEEQSNAKKHRK